MPDVRQRPRALRGAQSSNVTAPPSCPRIRKHPKDQHLLLLRARAVPPFAPIARAHRRCCRIAILNQDQEARNSPSQPKFAALQKASRRKRIQVSLIMSCIRCPATTTNRLTLATPAMATAMSVKSRKLPPGQHATRRCCCCCCCCSTSKALCTSSALKAETRSVRGLSSECCLPQ